MLKEIGRRVHLLCIIKSMVLNIYIVVKGNTFAMSYFYICYFDAFRLIVCQSWSIS